MVVLVVVLAVVALAAVLLVAITRRRLATQRAGAEAAEKRARAHEADLAADLAAKAAELESATAERTVAAALADARAEQLQAAEERARLAGDEAAAAAARADVAEQAADALRAVTASGIAPGGVDANVLWMLEQARSERTWRFSVASHPDSPTVFTDDVDPLLAAIQVELDAAREDVGAVVELDAVIPGGVTLAASVLALRATQELVADVVRRSEETIVRLRIDGTDLVVDVESIDEHCGPVLPTPLPLPGSAAVEATATGVRIRNAIGD